MSRGIVKRITGTFLLLVLSFTKGFSQDDAIHSVRVMFWNVENLFDIHNDTLTDDDEFLPKGLRRWNYTRYNRKITSLCKTIIAAGEWQPPAIVAFCEVENRKVLDDLIRYTGLSKFEYDILHEDSPDERGIDVALIYRKVTVKLLDYSYLEVSQVLENEYKTRDILYSVFLINHDTLHLFVNHWPSRRGGVMAGESNRIKIAGMLRDKMDSLISEPESVKNIIVTGDFNASPDDRVIEILKGNDPGVRWLENLSDNISPGHGTYRYMGIWETIDQVLVSEDLIKGNGRLVTGPSLFRVFTAEFLLTEDTKYPGLSPYSTYSGYTYRGGFSDHLPVVLDLILK